VGYIKIRLLVVHSEIAATCSKIYIVDRNVDRMYKFLMVNLMVHKIITRYPTASNVSTVTCT